MSELHLKAKLEQANAEIERLKAELADMRLVEDTRWRPLVEQLKLQLAQAKSEAAKYEDLYRNKGEQVVRFCAKNDELKLSAEKYRAILLKIADVTSALETNRTASYRDWEMREIARSALDGNEK